MTRENRLVETEMQGSTNKKKVKRQKNSTKGRDTQDNKIK